MTTIDLPPPADRAIARVRLSAQLARIRALAGRWGLRPLADDPRWLLPIALTTYVLGITWGWEFPDSRGIPFPPIWLAATGFALVVLDRRAVVGPLAVAGAIVLTAMVMTDVTLFWSQGMRDLELYLKAGDRWLAGAPVYTRTPLTVSPKDLSNYPFLYPPLTLPLFAAVGALPFPVAAGLWLGASLAAVLAGLRWIGLRWRWCVFVLAWPPIAQGLYVGNVAVPLFVLLAAAPWRPSGLAIAPIFKLYSGLATLWLLRREHWRSLVLGVGAVAGTALASLLLMDSGLWADWLAGLRAYQVSQQLLPNLLYGFGLARYLPMPVFVAVAAAVTVAGLRAAEPREQLARLGVATVTASPSLFSHGFLVALPAMLSLDAPWFWLALGITACSPGPAWFVVIGLVVAGWFVPAIRKRPGPDPWHPLSQAAAPWPTAGPAGASPEPSR